MDALNVTKDPLQLIDLTTCRTDFEAEVLVHALESEGIPAKAFTTAGSALQWEVAVTQPIRVQVRRVDLERAHAALTRVRQESVDFDWSELGAEEFDEVCKKCGYSLRDIPDKSVCPECGHTPEFGGEVGAVAPAPRRRRSRQIWTVVAIILLLSIALPFVFTALRMILGTP
jgi:hypothetical protein